ncbi:DUF1330 domain-containing protein [Aliiroseovarius sp. 2305UL8-7]|uniref:DUF1330 domain-containing protein n=1 Tax=Aliiroseovarius conchicola TaxID=3121637 RepID=UPI0035286BAC
MPAFVVSRVDINDAELMTSYMEAAPETVAQYGGRYVVRTGDIEVLEGTATCDRVVILEFPDKAQALSWYNSSEYAALRGQRWRAADASILLVKPDPQNSA